MLASGVQTDLAQRCIALLCVCDLEQFLRMHHIKGSGQVGDYNGPIIKNLMKSKHKLSELKEFVGKDYKDFLEHLRTIYVVHKVANVKKLNVEEAKKAFDQFERHRCLLQTKHDWNTLRKLEKLF